MGGNHSSVVVLRIRQFFWWMLPMGVRDNHTKYEPKLNSGGRKWVSQLPDLHFKICNLGPKSAFFLPKPALEPAENGQMKGNSGYSTHAARLSRAEGPSKGPLTPQYVDRPQKAPESPRICAHWPPTAANQKQTISWATWLKTQFRAHLIHPQPPTWSGFHPSKLP